MSSLYSFPVVIVAKSEVAARALHVEASKRLEAPAEILHGGMACDPLEYGCIGDKLVEYRRLQAQVVQLIDSGLLDGLLGRDSNAFRELVRTSHMITQMEVKPARNPIAPSLKVIPEPEPISRKHA